MTISPAVPPTAATPEEFLTAERLDRLRRRAEHLLRRYRVPPSEIEAGEVVHEAVLRLYPRWHTIRDVSNGEAWLHTVMKRIVIEALRRQLRAAGTPPLDDDIVTDDRTDEVVDRDAVDRLWARLAPRQRQVAYLRYRCGYSYLEIASFLNIAPNTVGPTINKTMAALRLAAMLVLFPAALCLLGVAAVAAALAATSPRAMSQRTAYSLGAAVLVLLPLFVLAPRGASAVLGAIGSAFIDIGDGRAAFLGTVT